jgi:hypothetical protein
MVRASRFVGLVLPVVAAGVLVFLSPAWGAERGRIRLAGLLDEDDPASTDLSLTMGDARAEKPPVVTPKPKPKPPSKQPAAPPPEPEQNTPPPSDLSSSAFGMPGERLAGMPNMLGNFNFAAAARLLIEEELPADINDPNVNPTGRATVALPLSTAMRAGKIAENGNTLPQDRIFFLYNHYQNAVSFNTNGLSEEPVSEVQSRDRYVLGFEKTFFDGWWSAELRMPISSRTRFDTDEFGLTGGHAGNLAVVVKRLLSRSDRGASCIGLSIDTPTGSNLYGRVFDTNFTIRNQAVHLMPYAGFCRMPTRRLFYQGFIQVDVPLNGNKIDFTDPSFGSGTFGAYHEQTLMYLDLETGYWLFRNPCSSALTGLAAILEFHYIGTLQNASSVNASTELATLQFTNPANRMDVVDMTVGLHVELAGNTLCRVAGVFPLASGDNRLFDGEVQVQLERRF